jgi:hypothetical protein
VADIDIKSLGIYIVEGTVEVDPVTGGVSIRTVNPKTGDPFSFDPIPAISMLNGKEVRFVLTPMASVSILEELHKKSLIEESDSTEKPGSN